MINTIYDEMILKAAEKFEDRRIVLGEGKVNADILLIGEAPGGEEEKQGRPFVGSAGKNLNEFLKVIKLERDDIYITNVVKIRPFKLSPKTGKPVNRPPDRNELEFFKEYLYREIDTVNPRIIVTLGNTALRAVLKDESASIGDLHGKIRRIDRFELFPLYHPASIIYNRGLKDVYLQDLGVLKEILHN